MISDSHTTAMPASYYLNLAVNILATIGAINWGLIRAFKLDFVGFLFGEMSTLSRNVYTLVGLAGLYLLANLGQRILNKS